MRRKKWHRHVRKCIKGSGRETFSMKSMTSTGQLYVSSTFRKNIVLNHFNLLKLKYKAHISLS